jgi:peptidoglycan hydrolase CwlO-like protein
MHENKILRQFFVAWLLIGACVISSISGAHATAISSADEYTQNKEQASNIKDNISSLQKKLDQATQKKQSLEKNLNQIKSSLNTTVAAIGKTKALLRETTDVIKRKELEVQLLEENIQFKKEMLTALMQEIYFNGDKPLVGVILGESDFSGALDEASTVTHLSEKVKVILDEVQDLKGQTESERVNLESMKVENERVLAEKAAQQKTLAGDQAETQSDIKDQEATIAELQKKMNKLKSELSSLLGANISTDDVMEAAAIASKATGVRKAFILAELTQESGLGRFTGGCLYKNTRVKPADKVAFTGIMKELGYDVNNKKISCSPGFGYGGAMGIAQFMPTTWLGYKAKIASMTGHNPPNPWNVVDGVVGMAIKLAAGGATSKGGEIIASKRYYCGSPASIYWDYSKKSNPGDKCNTYARNVQRLATGYEKN